MDIAVSRPSISRVPFGYALHHGDTVRTLRRVAPIPRMLPSVIGVAARGRHDHGWRALYFGPWVRRATSASTFRTASSKASCSLAMIECWRGGSTAFNSSMRAFRPRSRPRAPRIALMKQGTRGERHGSERNAPNQASEYDPREFHHRLCPLIRNKAPGWLARATIQT